MSMTRYNPFDAFLPLALRDPANWAADVLWMRGSFPIDLYEDEANYYVEASLPGMKPEAIKVTATDGVITIHAESKYDERQGQKPVEETKGKKASGYVRRERYTGEVTRVIELPTAISPDKITATYKHGVLTLEVPKTAESKPTEVEIKIER